MKETIFPTLEEALALHVILIDEFGGTHGVLDKGLLESALARPRSGYYTSLSEQAAALFQSLALNHPFLDGNKRMAFAITAIFLRMNGFTLVVSTSQGKKFIENDLIKNRASLDVITKWLEKHMQSIGMRTVKKSIT